RQHHSAAAIDRAAAAAAVVGFAADGGAVAGIAVTTIAVPEYAEIGAAAVGYPDAVAGVAPAAALDACAARMLALEHDPATIGGAFAGAAVVGFAADDLAAIAVVVAVVLRGGRRSGECG